MFSNDFSAKLTTLANQLRQLAIAHEDRTYTPAEEAMSWPLSVMVDDDGETGIWCDQRECLLDGHNSQILAGENFTAGELLRLVAAHIERNRERVEN
jgi:hypothetical protein